MSEYQSLIGGVPSRRTLNRMCNEGLIPGAEKRGGKWYVDVTVKEHEPDPEIAGLWEQYNGG